jgi:arylsulfatase
MDLLPTFLDIADRPVTGAEFQGREVLPVRGRSFWDLVTGAGGAPREAGDAVPWVVPSTRSSLRQAAMVRWPWKLYGERSNGAELRWSLFDLVSDPGERRDLALERPELTSELVSLWAASAR